MTLTEIQLNPSDWLGITQEGLYRVNKTRFYNPQYFSLIPSNGTQKSIISRLQCIEPEPDTTQLDHELNQINTIRLLKNKLITHCNGLYLYRDLKRRDEDRAILKGRNIAKAKKTIKRYLTELRQDSNFTLERVDKASINLVYNGEYASCKRQVSFNV